MANKYRINKIKQEHTIIKDILPLLEDISQFQEIKSIIPGRINQRNSSSGQEAYLKIKYNTSSGLKLIAKNSSSVQEVFIVTKNTDETKAKLQKLQFTN
ncbi:MAG: metal-binding protein [Halanaerobiales bacterium]|nr:metal-binding protein [Halanaerobiales bacterium]